MSSRLFAIQQLSLELCMAPRSSQKYYIIIPLSYSGWSFCCWQDCSCGCVVTLMLLIWLGPECIHATHILYCIAYPLSLFVSTSPSSVSLHLCHFFILVNYMYCCSSLLMRAKHWGLFIAEPPLTHLSNWIMHRRLKTPLIKKSPLWIKMLRRTHFLHREVTWCSRLPPVMRWKRDLTNGIKLFRLRGPFPLSDNFYDSSSNNLSNKLLSEFIFSFNDLLKTSKDRVVTPGILKEASPQRPSQLMHDSTTEINVTACRLVSLSPLAVVGNERW